MKRRLQELGFWRLPIIRPRLLLRQVLRLFAWSVVTAFLVSSGILSCEYPLHGIICFMFGAALAIILAATSQPAPRRTL